MKQDIYTKHTSLKIKHKTSDFRVSQLFTTDRQTCKFKKKAAFLSKKNC